MADGGADALLEVVDRAFSAESEINSRPSVPSAATLRAARIISEKLRRVPKHRKKMDLTELRRILARCRQPLPPPGPPTGATDAQTEHARDTLNLFEERLEEALGTYVATRGATRPPILPDPRYLDAASCTVYGGFLGKQGRNEARWAMARILMGLEDQWWWFGSDLTPWQREEILRAVRQRYDDLRGPTPVSGDPWGRDVSRLMLLSQCRDLLLALAFAYNWNDPV
jgi:hypothetical protein